MSARVVVMAGGTGGHVFPALAVARALAAHQREVVWLGTKRGIEARLVPAAGIHVEWIDIGGVRGKGPVSLLLAPVRVAQATWQALAALRRARPGVVLGCGGFVSGPGGLAAWLMRVPLVIHEQNAIAGLTNRLLSHLAQRVATAFPGSFPARLQRPVAVVGNPVRAEIVALAPPEARFAARQGPLRLLVFGGSQGARIMSEIVPGAIERCALALRSRFEVVQQCRAEDVAEVKAVYARLGLKAEVATFFSDLPARMAASQLVIARSGASTVAELAAIGRPAILVPLPHALDNDQLANATALAAAGGAMLVRQAEFTSERLAQDLAQLFGEPAQLAAMASSAKRTGNADAAERLADLVLRVARLA
jgi:UDP-N-acetylglucosamine--N-acetylmuramyl-(pentapeptide) pyrophosphoryl-undecaprenol N-acetylglucosamine transferase